MREAKAFAPCHITGIFQIFDNVANVLYAGSRGAGVSISQGVQTSVEVEKASRNSLQIKINGFASNSARVSNQVMKIFLSRFKEIKDYNITVKHSTEAPIGAGFGTSGAAALSLALALNQVFNLGLSRLEAAQLAHTAEVECKTGLGTVIAETFGGVEIRVKAGAPGIGEIKHMPVPKEAVVAALVFGPLPTKEFLTDEKTRRRVNKFGGRLIDELIEEPSHAGFMALSREFAEHVGLISDKVRAVLNATDDTAFVCSMPMFGESVFTLAERKNLGELLTIYRKYGSNERIVASEIDHEGARIS